jgi:hypothetical protein
MARGRHVRGAKEAPAPVARGVNVFAFQSTCARDNDDDDDDDDDDILILILIFIS